MQKLLVYFREETYYYIAQEKNSVTRGEIQGNDISAFLEEHRPQKICLLISKPKAIFRKLSFPFSQKRNISMVLPNELENLLPRGIGEFVVSWNFALREKEKSEVDVVALDRNFYETWLTFAKKYRFSLSITIDSFLLFNVFRKKIPGKSYAFLYADHKYLLLNLVENGLLSNCYSSIYHNESELSSHLGHFIAIIKKYDYPVYLYGDKNVFESHSVEGNYAECPEVPSGEDTCFMLPDIALYNPGEFISLKFKSFGSGTFLFSLPAIVLALCVAGICIYMISPYFRIPGERRYVENLKREMIQVFKKTCPAVSRVIDPLSQIKEKLKSVSHDEYRGPARVKVLKTLSILVGVIPENLNIEVVNITMNGETLFVAGKVEDLKGLDKFKTSIENTKLFSNVKIGNISFDAGKRVEFDIRVNHKDTNQ